MRILVISNHPGAGTSGSIEDFLGTSNNVAGPYTVVRFDDSNLYWGVRGCRVKREQAFSDPRGTWVYESDCYYSE